MAKIKICGITNITDAQLALELGADLLGFNFYKPSPRYIAPKKAAEIIQALSRTAGTVGIIVNESTEYIAELLKICPLDYVQLYGDQDDNTCREIARLGVEIIQAIRIKTPQDIEKARDCSVDMVLLDAYRQELFGGTGHTFDWGWLKDMATKKVFLAGGISPDNITDALAVGTYGIDLCSGIESEPGYKDDKKMRDLFKKIRQFH